MGADGGVDNERNRHAHPTETYGDIDAPFYDSLISVYLSAAELTTKTDNPALTAALRPRFEELVRDVEDLGWGIYDNLTDIYWNVLPQSEDEWA